MFFLRDLPSMQTLNELAERYSELDPTAMMTCIAVLRTGSDMMALLEKMLNPYGLSQGGYLTLIVLNRNPQEEISPSRSGGAGGGDSGHHDRVAGYFGQGRSGGTDSS
jgi:MarR family transcriptional repressor of emrRAB